MNVELLGKLRSTSGNEKERLVNKIIADTMPLVRSVVRSVVRRLPGHLAPVQADLADLDQCGAMRVARVMEQWDPAKGAWAPFVRARVADAVAKALPAQSVIKVSKCRPLVAQSDLRKAEAIKARTGRDATAEELHLDQETLDKVRAPRIRVSEDDTSVSESSAADATQHALRIDMSGALDRLDPRSKRVVLYMVVEGKTSLEVAALESLSDQGVLNILNQALEKMKRVLPTYETGW